MADGLISNEVAIMCGVHQRYILRPLFFLIYINGINKGIKRDDVRLCARDVLLYCSFDKIDEATLCMIKIKYTDQCNYLAVIMDSNLTFQAHINNVFLYTRRGIEPTIIYIMYK